jgi:phosphoserine phosphatase
MTRVEGGHPIPLAIDLDGTLIHTDLLHESVLYLLKVKPWLIFYLPYWLLKGKARLKSELTKVIEFPIDSLPYNKELIGYIQEQRGLGREIILCTASNQNSAQSIADYLGIFDGVLASNEHINLAGIVKAKTLSDRYGDKGFDYAGNSHADLAVWASAKSAIVVNGASSLIKRTKGFVVAKIFPRPVAGLKSWIKVFRLHQWVKNILIFIPAIAAHAVMTVDAWKDLILAFLSFSLCASFVYVINDLFDLESDRRHPRKRYRPFASGQIPIWIGAVLAPVLIFSSIVLALDVGISFVKLLCYYVA